MLIEWYGARVSRGEVKAGPGEGRSSPGAEEQKEVVILPCGHVDGAAREAGANNITKKNSGRNLRDSIDGDPEGFQSGHMWMWFCRHRSF